VRTVTVWHEPDHYWRADLDDIGTVLVGKPPGKITARGEPSYAVPEASALRAAQSMSQHLGVAIDGEQAEVGGTTTYSAHDETGARTPRPGMRIGRCSWTPCALQRATLELKCASLKGADLSRSVEPSTLIMGSPPVVSATRLHAAGTNPITAVQGQTTDEAPKR